MTSGKNSQAPWLEAAQQFQQSLMQQWSKATQEFPGVMGQSAAGGADPMAAWRAMMPQGAGMGAMGMPSLNDLFQKASGEQVSFDPAKLAAALIPLAGTDAPPARFAAGADAVQTFEAKAATLLAQANAFRELSSSLDHATS